MASKGKNRSAARQAVKNHRRFLKRNSQKPVRSDKKPTYPSGQKPDWMQGKPMMKFGTGGTDKSFLREAWCLLQRQARQAVTWQTVFLLYLLYPETRPRKGPRSLRLSSLASDDRPGNRLLIPEGSPTPTYWPTG